METSGRSSLCRLCLSFDDSAACIFEPRASHKENIAALLIELLQFEVYKNDGYSEMVCRTCLKTITDFKKFKETCVKSMITYDKEIRLPEHGIVQEQPEVEVISGDGFANSLIKHECAPDDLDVFSKELYEEENFSSEDQEESSIPGVSVDEIRDETGGPKYTEMDDKGFTNCNIKLLPNSDTSCNETIQEEVPIEIMEHLVKIEDSGSNYYKDANLEQEAVLDDEESFTLKLEEDDSDNQDNCIEGVGLEDKHGCIQDKNDMNCFSSESFSEQDVCNGIIEHIDKNPEKEHVSSDKKQQIILMKNSKDKCLSKRGKHSSGRKSYQKDKISTASTNKKKSYCNKKVYICDICGKVSSTRQDMAYHVRVHSGARPHMCKFCNKSFTQSSSLKEHLNIHLGIKPFQCKCCHKSFTHRSALLYHKRHHMGERNHQCDQCLKSFFTKRELKRHQLFHNKKRPFLCSECGKGFISKSYVNAHMTTHSGLKQFKCNVCSASFYQNVELKRHSIIHMEVKPITCAFCKRYFQCSSKLKNHKCAQKSESGYSCGKCSMKFSGIKSLRRHERFCKNR